MGLFLPRCGFGREDVLKLNSYQEETRYPEKGNGFLLFVIGDLIIAGIQKPDNLSVLKRYRNL
jgi:hypothetical protein